MEMEMERGACVWVVEGGEEGKGPGERNLDIGTQR